MTEDEKQEYSVVHNQEEEQKQLDINLRIGASLRGMDDVLRVAATEVRTTTVSPSPFPGAADYLRNVLMGR